ncbi:hypothetical protein QA612_10320 [Evansella sp. AB-P1]|uniref:glycosyl hydrolase family 28-related protein n=1 Tax=Evansella sp. AB-P1 TaxID=3037653 RepID=UPI00241EE685|nr:hypothetical protein [Evansella sp. AB-P1]MDG5787894.1 hypothetical protein [Evansella sp. AB-P1]
MKKKRIIIYSLLFFTFLLLAVLIIQLNNGKTVSKTIESSKYYVHVDDFGADGDNLEDDSQAIQAAIDHSYESNISKVRLTGNKHYVIKSGIIVREGVELEFDQNTRLFIEGNFRAIELEKNASITNGIIEVTNNSFDSEVIYLDGKHQFWSWERTHVRNVTIVNSSGTRQGTALALFADGPNHFISFVNFTDLNIVGFNRGIYLEAVEQENDADFTWVNGNRFVNITLDDCVNCIELIGSITIPYETTGNEFTSLQVQLTSYTESVLSVMGSDNKFDGVIWDVHELVHEEPIITFSRQSTGNFLTSNILSEFISDEGYYNYFTSPVEEARN